MSERPTRRAALLLGLLLLIQACDSTPPPAPAGVAERLEVGGLPNLARVSKRLYRGGQPADEGYRWLAAQGFTTVINLRYFHGNPDDVAELGLKGVRIRLFAAHVSTPPTEQQVEEFLRLATDPNEKVYLHCKFGSDRTGTMAAIYRIEVDGWSNERAVAEMQHFGYHDWYRDLIEFVREYQPARTRDDEPARTSES